MKRFVLILALLLVGCKPANQPAEPGATSLGGTRIHLDIYKTVDRITDCNAMVVCYTITAQSGAGLSCLPISQTDLSEEDLCK